MKLKSILLTAVTTISLATATMAQQWNVKTPMPTTRAGIGATSVNNIIYVIGGSDGLNVVGIVEAYDPSTNTWQTKAPMPTPRVELGVATVNGKIYAIGGTNGIALNTVEEYDPSTNTWSSKANMPTSRSNVSVAVYNGKIYAIGGWPYGISAVEEYDPLSDTWTSKTPLSQGRINTNGSTTLNNKVYFSGGKTNSTVFSIHEAYDPITNNWITKANLPNTLWSGASVTLNNKIHFLGGTNSLGQYLPNFSTHYVYDENNNSWSTALPLLNNRSNHAAVVVNNKIYVIGGNDNIGSITNLNEEYSECSNNTLIIPQTNSLTTGSTATFTATTSDPNPNYVWQSDFGQGFQTLTNFGNYSGVNTSTLNIANVQLPNHTQPIRVITTSGNCIDTSNVAVINILDTCLVTVYDTLLTTVTDTLVINTQITGINPPNNLNTLKVFPNPASTHITIDYGNFNAMNGYTLTIVNSIGQTVFTTPINQQTSYIDLSTWTGNGIYFVQLIDPQNNTIENRKIVIQ
jgi:N-acetylneuraminic acid mutarotase